MTYLAAQKRIIQDEIVFFDTVDFPYHIVSCATAFCFVLLIFSVPGTL